MRRIIAMVREELRGIQMKRLLLTSACLLVFANISSTQAVASAFTVDGAYDSYDLGKGGGQEDGFDFDGAANLPLPWSDLSVELNLGDEGVGGLHTFNGGSGVVWTDPDFRLAGTVVYNRGSANGSHLDETTIGGGGEWYPSNWLTLGAQGGAIAGRFAGGFASATVKGYVTPDLSIAGFTTFSDWKVTFLQKFIDETDVGVKGELLVSEDMPLTIQAGYTHQQIDGFGGLLGPAAHDNVFSIGVTLYLDDSWTPMPLIQHNRTGTLDTIGPIHPVWFNG
jgi:hypothetical protein